MFDEAAKASAKQVVKSRRVKARDTGEHGRLLGAGPEGWLKVKWDNRQKPTLIKRSEIKLVRGLKAFKNPIEIRRCGSCGQVFGQTTECPMCRAGVGRKRNYHDRPSAEPEAYKLYYRYSAKQAWEPAGHVLAKSVHAAIQKFRRANKGLIGHVKAEPVKRNSRTNGIVEAAAGLQALEYIGAKAKKSGLGRKPKYNPPVKGSRDAFGVWHTENPLPAYLRFGTARARKALALERKAKQLIERSLDLQEQGKQAEADRVWAQAIALKKRAKAAGEYTQGPIQKLPNPTYFWSANTRTRGRLEGTVTATTKRAAKKRVKQELNADGVGRIRITNPGNRPRPSRPKQTEWFVFAKNGYRLGSVYASTQAAARAAAFRKYGVSGLRVSTKRARNPSVEDLSRTFQGEADGSLQRDYAATGAPSNLARAGKLVFLKVAGRTIRIPGATVAIAPNKRLWITGDHAPLFETKARNGEGLDVGEVSHICYETAKAHIGEGKTFEYVHEFGEDGGRRPHLIIDHEGMPILRGGDYEVKAEGIVN